MTDGKSPNATVGKYCVQWNSCVRLIEQTRCIPCHVHLLDNNLMKPPLT